MRTTTIAERLDHALDAMMDGAPPGRAAAGAGLTDAGRSLVVTADRLRHALPVPSVAPRFEARVGARLATSGGAADPMRWVRGHPGRLIVTGAVGSAVGVGVTAYAVWRSTRRPALRAWHR